MKKNKKNLPRSTRVNLSNQTNNLGYEIKITPWKKNKKNYEDQITTNPVLKDEIKKLKKMIKTPQATWTSLWNS